VPAGPLIPGLQEYDAPRRRRGGFLPWVLLALGLLAALTLIAGLIGGVGPLRALGAAESSMEPVAWRPTGSELVIQVAVAVPSAGFCAGDEVKALAVERGPRIEVSASRTQPRNQDVCSGVGIAGDRVWVDVAIDAPVAGRPVIRTTDRQPLPQEEATPAEGVEQTPSPGSP
jgi:hypothetical protein